MEPLDLDQDIKDKFIYNSFEDSENEKTPDVKISKENHNSINVYLLENLLQKQNDFLILTKRNSKLKSDLRLEEIKSRYLKLDLNNEYIKVSESLKENKNCKIIILVLSLFSVFSIFY